MSRQILAVLYKELLELRRDLRGLVTALAYGLIGPLMIWVVLSLWERADRRTAPPVVAVTPAEPGVAAATVEQGPASLPPRGRLLLLAVAAVLAATPFLVGIPVASDCTAGERERNALAPLLYEPLRPAAIVIAKWASVVVVGLSGTLLALAGMVIVLAAADLSTTGLDTRTIAAQLGWILVLLLPATFTVAAAQVLIGLRSNSFKEGQTYLSLLSFAPFLLPLALSAVDWTSRPVPPVPLVFEAISLPRAIGGEHWPLATLASLLVTHGALTLALLAAASRHLPGLALVRRGGR